MASTTAAKQQGVPKGGRVSGKPPVGPKAVTYMLPASSMAMPPGRTWPSPPTDVEKRIAPVGSSLVT